MVLAMDNDKTTGNGYLMDATMDYGKEMVRQWQQQLRSIVVAVLVAD
jgi:hypothetical protein